MPTCQWCLCETDEGESHRDLLGCMQALRAQYVKESQHSAQLHAENIRLRNELIDERTLVAHLTERLEICKSCPQDGKL